MTVIKCVVYLGIFSIVFHSLLTQKIIIIMARLNVSLFNGCERNKEIFPCSFLHGYMRHNIYLLAHSIKGISYLNK